MLRRSTCSLLSLAACLSAQVQCTPAFAQNISEPVDPRSVGRANTSTVSGDSGVALTINPGAMVRRSQPRLIFSAQIADSELHFDAHTEQGGSPAAANLSGPSRAPQLAYHHGNKAGTWVLGIVLASGRENVSLPTPSFSQPANDVQQLFPHRYGGTHFESEWRRIAVGGALRIGESLVVGISGSISQVSILESRRIWAGFDGRDQLLNPQRDLALSISGDDSMSPGVSLGFLLAPPEVPLEFALAGEFRRGPTLRGDVTLRTTQSASFPIAGVTAAATSNLALLDSYTIRSGLRYLGKKSTIEVGADFYLLPRTSRESWQLQGVSITDDSTLTAELNTATAAVHQRNTVAVRAAYDYEAVPGFLWLTTGYSWTSPASPTRLLVPTYAKLGGHTLALGFEAAHDRYLITLGYARRLKRSRSLDADFTETQVINPFDAGSGPVGNGRYETSSDEFGFSLEVSWQ